MRSRLAVLLAPAFLSLALSALPFLVPEALAADGEVTADAAVTDATLKPFPLAIAAESGARVEGEDLHFLVSLEIASPSLDSNPLCGGGLCTRGDPVNSDPIQQLALLNGVRSNPSLARQERIKLSVRVETSGSNPVQVHPEDTGERVIVLSHQLPVQILKVRTLSVADSNNSAIRVIVEELGESAARASVAVMDVSARPVVEGAPQVSGTGDDGNWSAGGTVEVELAFTEAVEVDTTNGTPTLEIQLGGTATGTRSAAYAGGSGTTALTFGYNLVQGDGSHTVVSVIGKLLGHTQVQTTARYAHLGACAVGKLATICSSIRSFVTTTYGV